MKINIPGRRVENIINTVASCYGLPPSGIAKLICMIAVSLCLCFIIGSIPLFIYKGTISLEDIFDYRIVLFIILALDMFDNEDITKFLLSSIVVIMSTALVAALFSICGPLSGHSTENFDFVNYLFPFAVTCSLVFNAIRKAARSFELSDKQTIDQGKLPQQRWWIFKYIIFITGYSIAILLCFISYYLIFCKIETQVCILGFVMIALYVALFAVGLAMSCIPRPPIRSVKKSRVGLNSFVPEQG